MSAEHLSCRFKYNLLAAHRWSLRWAETLIAARCYTSMCKCFLAICLSGFSLTLAASETLEAQQAARESFLNQMARVNVDAREFRRLYPDAIIEYWYIIQGNSDFWDKYDQLQLSVGLYDRYVAYLYVSFLKNTTNFNQARIRIQEVDRVDGNLKFWGRSQDFKSSDWDLLRKNRGDFAAIGHPLLTNNPVIGFDRAWDKMRWKKQRK